MQPTRWLRSNICRRVDAARARMASRDTDAHSRRPCTQSKAKQQEMIAGLQRGSHSCSDATRLQALALHAEISRNAVPARLSVWSHSGLWWKWTLGSVRLFYAATHHDAQASEESSDSDSLDAIPSSSLLLQYYALKAPNLKMSLRSLTSHDTRACCRYTSHTSDCSDQTALRKARYNALEVGGSGYRLRPALPPP